MGCVEWEHRSCKDGATWNQEGLCLTKAQWNDHCAHEVGECPSIMPLASCPSTLPFKCPPFLPLGSFHWLLSGNTEVSTLHSQAVRKSSWRE